MKTNKNFKRLRALFLFVALILIVLLSFNYIKNNQSNSSTSNTVNNLTVQEPSPCASPDLITLYGEEKATEIPILMYHFFYDASSGQTGANSNWTEISDFDAQMKYLHDNNYYFPTWEEIYEFVQGTIELPKKSIVVTADDGNMTFFELAIPVLNKYNVKATSFLVTSWVNVDYVNSFRSDLICFESHSHNMHVAGSDGNGAFLTLTEAKAKEDLDSTKEILQSPIAFCYPFGHYNDFAKRMLTEEGFKVAVTTESGKIKPGMDPLELPRVRISKGDTLEQFVNKIN